MLKALLPSTAEYDGILHSRVRRGLNRPAYLQLRSSEFQEETKGMARAPVETFAGDGGRVAKSRQSFFQPAEICVLTSRLLKPHAGL